MNQMTWITDEQVSGQMDLPLDAPDVVLVEVSPPRTPKQSTVMADNPRKNSRLAENEESI